ncbi:MAG: rhodanese-like domain-containing protein [Bacteroidia bacterium]|nr:rhodanese-like domain-containing protein [Bacteroidia bacterium]
MVHEINGREGLSLLQNASGIALDVRSLTEFNDHHILNALHIDVLGIHAVERFNALDKNANYLVYCAIGVRSRSAIRLMEQLGFHNLYHLTSGILNHPELLE